jgi:diacylglycerol kinase family enzyme
MGEQGFLALVSKKAGHYRPNVYREMSQAFARAGIPLRFHYVEDNSEAAEEVDRALKAGCQDFLAVGGDGTVSLAASYLYGKPHRLGIIPAGTANTLARILGVPMNIKKAIRLAATSRKMKPVDGMEVGGQIYLLNVSTGLSSISLDGLDVKQKAKAGMFSYVVGVARASLKVAPCDYELTIDGRACPVRAIEIHVTNTGVLGTLQYHLNETSRIDDGKVEVLGLSHLSPVTVVDAVLDVLMRRKKRAIRLIGVGSEITIHSAQVQAVQGDGDIIGPTPVKIKVRPRAINFIVH